MGMEHQLYIGPYVECESRIAGWEYPDARRLAYVGEGLPQEFDIYIPNIKYDAPIASAMREMRDGESGVRELNLARGLTDEMVAFEETFFDDIAAMYESYNGVRTKYGVVSYWM